MEDPVIIIGGGVMGSALAYWLTRLDRGVGVIVIERDLSYEYASSALSAASIRQQFSTAANIRISQASIAFLRRASDELAIGDERPTITLREQGYLYLAGAEAAAELRSSHALQKDCGADVALMDPASLGKKFGWLNTSDLSLGSLGLSGEGWFDGYALLTAFARKARHRRRAYHPCHHHRRHAHGLQPGDQRRRPLGTARRRHGRHRPTRIRAATHRLCHLLPHRDVCIPAVDRYHRLLDSPRRHEVHRRIVARR
jgi:glycine/D-amino acid oxidase-like deaminating enzyme